MSTKQNEALILIAHAMGGLAQECGKSGYKGLVEQVKAVLADAEPESVATADVDDSVVPKAAGDA